MESNKPYWDNLEPWANFIACDEDGMWYQYDKRPPVDKIYDIDGVHKWNAAENGKFEFCGNVADKDWAKLYWKSSVEARPSSNSQEVVKTGCETKPVKTFDYSSSEPSKHKRVTIFLEFDDAADKDASLANLVAKMLVNKMNDTYLSSAGSNVDSAKIAVGVMKYEEIKYDPDHSEFYIVGEGPDPDDDDDNDDDDDDDDDDAEF